MATWSSVFPLVPTTDDGGQLWDTATGTSDRQALTGDRQALDPAIGIVEDPAVRCSGPLWVRGGITIESEDGSRYEKRNPVTPP
jgi:hypothetical protein